MRSMSGLKSVCPVILSGNLVAVIFSPGFAITLRSAVPLPPDTNLILIDFWPPACFTHLFYHFLLALFKLANQICKNYGKWRYQFLNCE